jgi:2-methylcitrate dehydratase PrpD
VSPSRYTEELAGFVAGLSFGDIPPAVVAHARLCALDTLGCGLQGSTLPWSRIAQAVAEEEGGRAEARVWGTRTRASRQQAAWLNATAAHGFEFDDVHMGGMIHPGSLTLSAALAVGEVAELNGAELLVAVVAGCEAGARVGQALGTDHFLRGFHPQGTIGAFAAAAAAARALGLDPELTGHAFGIAASHACGLMGAQRGAMVKRLHAGHAAQSGVLSALLAARGFTGTTDVLDAEFGHFCSTLGGSKTDFHRLTGGLGTRWETSQIAFKMYPSCAAAQASIEAVRVVREAHDLAPDMVDVVMVTTSEHVRTHSGWTYQPEGVTAAQMSIGYGVAQMLIDGSLEARHFEEPCIDDPRVVALARRVEVVSDPAIDRLGPERRYQASVVVRTTDGRELRQDIDDRPGNTSNPLSEAQLTAKFMSLAAPVVGDEHALRLRELVMAIDEHVGVDALGELTSVEPAVGVKA